MQSKIFRSSGVGIAATLIAGTSFLSYFIGLFRDRIIAIHFGTTTAADTYNASFIIPDMIFNLFIAGALTAAFLPVFSEYLSKNKEEAIKIGNTMLTGAVIVIILFSILAFIFMKQIVPFAFAGVEYEAQKDIINMTRIMLGSAVLFAISNTLGNILMSYKHFVSYALSPILYNLGIIFGVIFLYEKIGIYSAATGVIIGAILHCLIRVVDVFSTGYRYKPVFNFLHPGFKKIIKLMIPKSISLIAWQINLYIIAIVGIGIQTGALASFNFARNIQSFPVSLFGIAFATAVFPYLSNAASENNKTSYTNHVRKTLQRILFFTIPASAGILFLSRPLVELILSGGAFQEESIVVTSLILSFFAFSIPFESMSHIFSRAFYALQNTITPTIINILAMGIISTTAYFVAPIYGVEWFSIGFAIGFIFYTVTMMIFLRKHLKGFGFSEFFKSLTKTLIATALMVLIIKLSAPLEEMMPVRLSHASRIVLGAGTFFLSAIIIKSPEIDSIKYILKRILPSKVR